MRVFAFLLIISVLPVIIVVSLILVLTSKSGVVFKQERLGKKKKPFVIYKFTTMHENQVTLVGRYLRKTGIDEFPQLVNVLKGEMALVGPRPLTEADVIRLKWHEDSCAQRWDCLPGITGLAQLNKVCDAQLSLERDLYYVRHKSVGLDFKICLQSLRIPLLGKQKNR